MSDVMHVCHVRTATNTSSGIHRHEAECGYKNHGGTCRRVQMVRSVHPHKSSDCTKDWRDPKHARKRVRQHPRCRSRNNEKRRDEQCSDNAHRDENGERQHHHHQCFDPGDLDAGHLRDIRVESGEQQASIEGDNKDSN